MGCPKGTPETQTQLSFRNWTAFQYHQKCKLTGKWPNDDLVAENGVMIEEVLRSCHQQQVIDHIAMELKLALLQTMPHR